MKWTTRSRYSLKALLDLALAAGDAPKSVRAIAERQGIPAPYLEKLLIELRHAGLVKSQRGAYGGYRLARSAKAITLADILAAVGERIEPLDLSEEAGSDDRVEDWVTQAVWKRISTRLERVLAEITLEDLYFDARSRQAAQSETTEFMV